MSTDVKIPQAITLAQHPDAKGVKLPIYMDNHATTPMDPRVLEEMLPYFMEKFGNSASRNHSFGWAAEEGVETARERIAKLIGATTKEIIFTSGATESDNLAIKGVAEMYREKGNHIITAVTEHKAVLDTCKRLEKYGYRVTYMPVQKDGLVDLDDLKRAMDDKTILVTIMAANNEIGVLQPIEEIGKLCRERGVIFHTDATQAVGKVPMDVNQAEHRPDVDLGPQDVRSEGRGRVVCAPQESARADFRHHRWRRPRAWHALGHIERPRHRRPGQGLCHRAARDAAGVVPSGGPAQPLARPHHGSVWTRSYINGSMEHRLPGNLNISFAYVEGESLLMGINDIAVSSGSACTSATLEPSYVLKALGTGDDLAHSSIRFGIGRFNTEAEVDYVADRVIETVERLRELSPLYEMAKEGINLKDVKWAGEAH